MEEDVQRYLPGLMVAAGGILQWLRQFKSFREWYYHVIAVVLGVGAFALVTPFDGPLRLWVLSCIDFLTVGGGGLAMIYGGTFIVSTTAKKVAAASPTLGEIGVAPVTNSK